VFDFDYNLTTTPELIQDIGHGRVTVTNLNMIGSASPKREFNNKKNKEEYEIDISNI